MKVVLISNVENLGKEGEVKDVAAGYARNCLFPKKLAEPATAEAMKKVADRKAKSESESKMELEKAQQLAEQLEGMEIVIAVKEKDGKMFGSVNAKSIIKHLKEQGIEIEPANIDLKEPIKEVGEYEIKINLDHGLEANTKLIVSADMNS